MDNTFFDFMLNCLDITKSTSSKVKVDLSLCIKKQEIPKLLKFNEEIGINTNNVLKYLSYKYIPYREGSDYILNSLCIKRFNSREVIFTNSELHKIITDLNYISRLIDFDDEITIRFESIRVISPDRIMYYLYFKKAFGIEIDLPTSKIRDYRDILTLRRSSFRKKWLRIYVISGHLTPMDLIKLNLNRKGNFSDSYIDDKIAQFPLPNISTLL